MKALVILIVLALIVVGLAMYFTGGSFDPQLQGEQVKAAIDEGMSVEQVLEVKEPRKWRVVRPVTRRIGGVDVEDLSPGPELKFEREKMEAMKADGELEHGYVFQYVFTNELAFEVHFSSEHKVEAITDLVTMSDLLQHR